jgi:hypothetical protein
MQALQLCTQQHTFAVRQASVSQLHSAPSHYCFLNLALICPAASLSTFCPSGSVSGPLLPTAPSPAPAAVPPGPLGTQRPSSRSLAGDCSPAWEGEQVVVAFVGLPVDTAAASAPAGPPLALGLARAAAALGRSACSRRRRGWSFRHSCKRKWQH